jgi:two-component system nitrate/nitrite response regulator NarL
MTRRDHPTRILLADDHPLLLEGVRQVLEEDGRFAVVAEARNGAEVVSLLDHCDAEVALIDVRMPGMDGFECLDRIRAAHPRVKVVLCSMQSDPVQIQAAFRRGACGYVVKSVDPRDLAAAIRQAIDGTAFHALGLPALEDETSGRALGLSDRELEIMKAVARGLSNRAIAQELWITEQTVKFHLTNIFKKLGLANRTEAAGWALSKGLQEPTLRPLLSA